jgi:hypothetical protein
MKHSMSLGRGSGLLVGFCLYVEYAVVCNFIAQGNRKGLSSSLTFNTP